MALLNVRPVREMHDAKQLLICFIQWTWDQHEHTTTLAASCGGGRLWWEAVVGGSRPSPTQGIPPRCTHQLPHSILRHT